jgi:hypothetical protein
VSWWSVHEFIAAQLGQVDNWPMVGTQAWCELPDTDARKIAAIYDAAQHWALRIDTCQQAMADAGSEISAAADWSAIARKRKAHNEFYAARPWLRRRPA